MLQPGRNESVERTVQRRVRHRSDMSRDHVRRSAERGQGFLCLGWWAGPARDEDTQRISVSVLRDEGKRRRDLPGKEGAEFSRRTRDVLVEGAHDLLRILF